MIVPENHQGQGDIKKSSMSLGLGLVFYCAKYER